MEKLKVQRHYRKIIGASFRVHFFEMGFGKLLSQSIGNTEMNIKGINYQSEVWHNIFYRDLQNL